MCFVFIRVSVLLNDAQNKDIKYLFCALIDFLAFHHKVTGEIRYTSGDVVTECKRFCEYNLLWRILIMHSEILSQTELTNYPTYFIWFRIKRQLINQRKYAAFPNWKWFCSVNVAILKENKIFKNVVLCNL